MRYKGFSSYSSSREKNPFNIKLDHIHNGQNHQGYKKLKLSNVIQDPSFLRETLTYEIARKYMPASQANYANLYVNDVLIGLYTNVEDVSKEFVDKHFGSRGNAFIKGNPTTVDLNVVNAATLAGVDMFIGTWVSGPDGAAFSADVQNFLLAGGDVFLLQDNAGHDVLGSTLGTAHSSNFMAIST